MNRGDRFRERSGGAVGAYLARGRGRASMRVGNWLYHSVGDKEDSIESLAADYTQAYREIAEPLGLLPPYGPENRAKAAKYPAAIAWWGNVAQPLFTAWNAFKGKMLGTDYTRFGGYIGYGNRAAMDWDELQAWRKKLIDLRTTAQMFGLVPTYSKPPAELPTTVTEDVEHVVERGASKVASAVGDVWTLGKVAAYGAIALGAGLLISSIVTNVRNRQDPAAPYLRLAAKAAE